MFLALFQGNIKSSKGAVAAFAAAEIECLKPGQVEATFNVRQSCTNSQSDRFSG